jgi:selenocysteine lyase/cysteine desulfurase
MLNWSGERLMLDLRKVREQFPITRQKFEVSRPRRAEAAHLHGPRREHAPADAGARDVQGLPRVLYANVHRGRHTLSEKATESFEHVTEDIFRFIKGRVAPATP